jgi:hypothetical protein
LQEDCDCNQKLVFDSSLTNPKAELKDFVLFTDPLTKEDWKPRLAVMEGGWSMERPNMLWSRLEVDEDSVIIKGKVRHLVI